MSKEDPLAEKLAVRQGLANRTGALMRAWHLGMFVARDPAEEEMLRSIEAVITVPASRVEDAAATSLTCASQIMREPMPRTRGISLL